MPKIALDMGLKFEGTRPVSKSAWIKRSPFGLIFLLGSFFAHPCHAQTDETGGIGGTGIKHETGGIGGTGITPETGGIGGTGIHNSGTPIIGYGPIQAFGSVFVNGREYAVNANTLVSINGAPATVASLRIGDIAQINGVALGPHGGFAQKISILNAIIGPVTAVSANGANATVLGQNVVSAGHRPLFSGIRPGAMVAVSAQRQFNGDWAARNVTMLPNTGHFQLVAPLSAIGTGVISIAGNEIKAPAGLAAPFTAGERVIVSGSVGPNGLVATQLNAAPINLGGGGTNVEVETYFRATKDGTLEAADGIVAVGAPASLQATGTEPVEIIGKVSDDDIISVDAVNADPSAIPAAQTPVGHDGAVPNPLIEQQDDKAIEPSEPRESGADDDSIARPKSAMPETEAPSRILPDHDLPEIAPNDSRPELPDIEFPEIHGAPDD